jgi:hypothetical protein
MSQNRKSGRYGVGVSEGQAAEAVNDFLGTMLGEAFSATTGTDFALAVRFHRGKLILEDRGTGEKIMGPIPPDGERPKTYDEVFSKFLGALWTLCDDVRAGLAVGDFKVVRESADDPNDPGAGFYRLHEPDGTVTVPVGR